MFTELSSVGTDSSDRLKWAARISLIQIRNGLVSSHIKLQNINRWFPKTNLTITVVIQYVAIITFNYTAVHGRGGSCLGSCAS